MRAGPLRHKIIIDKPTYTQDSFGEGAITYTSEIGTWASIAPLRGREYWSAQQVTAGVSHKVTMRYRELPASTGIDQKCRVRFGSRIFQIKSIVNPDERDISLELMCEEEV